MTDGDAGRCEPYRVEWRPALEADWIVGWHRETLGEAEDTSRQLVIDYGGQARVMEQRVVLVRGLGQDGGPDQAFADFFERNREAAERQAVDALAQADGLARAMKERRAPDPGALSEPEESEQAMPDGLLFSERELWQAATVDGFIDGGDMLDVLARLARVRAELRAQLGPSVLSDPDDRRAVEAAADAGEPLDQARTILNQLADTDTQRQAIRDATVTDTAGCAHRMSSGAVSLTACGECGAQPGDDCAERSAETLVGVGSCSYRTREFADMGNLPCMECGADPGDPCADSLEDRIAWAERDGGEHVAANLRRARALATPRFMHRTLDGLGVPRHDEPEQQTATSDEDMTEAERVLDATAAKIGGTSPLEAMMRETSADVDALLAEHGKPHGTDPWWRRLLQRARQ